MKSLRNGLKKLALVFVFFSVLFCPLYSAEAKEQEYIITESQIQVIKQNNLTIQSELEELKKQQKAQIEFSKKLEEEKENLQKEIEKEKKTSKTMVDIIPLVFVLGAVVGGVCTGLILK